MSVRQFAGARRLSRPQAVAIAAACTLAFAAASARADDGPVAHRLGYAVDVPAGWAFDAERSNTVSRGLGAERHYDGLRTDLGADAYVGGRAALFVQWIHARDRLDGAQRLELTMRRTFDQIRGAASAGKLVRWREDVRDDMAEGHLEWWDPAGAVTLVRALVYVTDDDRLRQVRAECVYSEKQPTDRTACERALASLTLTEATGPRGTLGAVPGAGTLRVSGDSDAPAEIDVQAAPGVPTDGDADRGSAGDDAMGDGGEPAAAGGASETSGVERRVLAPPTISPAPGSGDDGTPRVLYQAPPDAPRPTNRTNQLIGLIGGILIAAAIYAMMRERRHRSDNQADATGEGPGGGSPADRPADRPTDRPTDRNDEL